VTIAEAKRWGLDRAWGRKKIENLERALAEYYLLPPDVATAEAWARVFTSRKQAGRPIGTHDCWIAATALRHGLPLITHNLADYRGIDGLEIVSHAPK